MPLVTSNEHPLEEEEEALAFVSWRRLAVERTRYETGQCQPSLFCVPFCAVRQLRRLRKLATWRQLLNYVLRKFHAGTCIAVLSDAHMPLWVPEASVTYATYQLPLISIALTRSWRRER